LATLIEWIGFVNYHCEEIGLAQSIHDILSLSHQGLTVSKPLPSRPGGGGSSGNEMSGGGGGLSSGGGGPSGGGDPSCSKSGKKREGTCGKCLWD
jgi:hypothetical protein